MRVYVPDFNIFHSTTIPDLFFRKVEQKGTFVWRNELLATQFEEDYNDETNGFEEAMLKLIGVALDCVKVGNNGELYHVSTKTFEVISKSFV